MKLECKKLKQWVCGLGLFLLAGQALAAVEVTDEENTSYTKTAGSGREMRGVRRAGVGFVGGGLAGIAGLSLEINFLDNFGLLAGGGVSTDFRSFFGGGKYVFGGKWLLPYMTAGFVQWSSYGEQRDVGDTTPGFFGKRFLSDDERRKGNFAENMLFAGLGIQYLQLKGDWAGFAPYLEVDFLGDIDDISGAVTSQIGVTYYF